MKHLIELFFTISNDNNPASGQRFADEVLAPDGVLKMGERLTYRGPQGNKQLLPSFQGCSTKKTAKSDE
jgi:hypothetical protein